MRNRMKRVLTINVGSSSLKADCERMIAAAAACAREHFEDEPEIRDWVWSD
jgi:xylulose-5-phosphate/fructose-6-phosphate phosphoketolase